jgi:SAM-dependent methyltransferase
MIKASNSVGQIGSARSWAWENLQFLRMRVAGLRSKEAELTAMVAELDAYRELYQSLTGGPFETARIFEVGYGARPLRLLSLLAMGLDARGIDLDAPMLERSAGDLLRILKQNGPLRFFKSSVRALVFDAHERNALSRVLARRGAKLSIEPHRFLVGDVAHASIAPESVDFLYSEDVFEHIPRQLLDAVCAGIARALAPGGIAVITPAIYSGIAGGHLVEWYPHTLTEPHDRRSEPWEHLRKRRFIADCVLNEVRVAEFRDLFERHFTVHEDRSLQPGMAREFLTPAVRTELSGFSEEELLSYQWRFVLRKRS